MLLEILGRVSPVPVELATDAQPVEPNRAYISPPNCTLLIEDGRLRLAEVEQRATRA